MYINPTLFETYEIVYPIASSYLKKYSTDGNR